MEPPPWVALDDVSLLDRKIRSLGLVLEGTVLAPFVRQLHEELAAKGLVFAPPCHVGDEWFVPVGIPVIFVPFFLVHDRLRELERRMMLEVEGETPAWCMRLMRHEAGHAFSYAYQMQRKRRWQQTFGLASQEDTGFYRPRPYSRSYVVHLDDWYAQAHPDEDFAETFAVWLTPGLDWRTRYHDWKALQKLEYVDELMRSLAGVPPPHQPACRVAEYDCLGLKLKTYYARKRKYYADSYPDFYDRDLRTLFPTAAVPDGAGLTADAYLRRHRRAVMHAVCTWTNESQYRVDKLLHRLTERCAELKLVVGADDGGAPLRVSSYVTTLVMNYLFTGRFQRRK